MHLNNIFMSRGSVDFTRLSKGSVAQKKKRRILLGKGGGLGCVVYWNVLRRSSMVTSEFLLYYVGYVTNWKSMHLHA